MSKGRQLSNLSPDGPTRQSVCFSGHSRGFSPSAARQTRAQALYVHLGLRIINDCRCHFDRFMSSKTCNVTGFNVSIKKKEVKRNLTKNNYAREVYIPYVPSCRLTLIYSTSSLSSTLYTILPHTTPASVGASRYGARWRSSRWRQRKRDSTRSTKSRYVGLSRKPRTPPLRGNATLKRIKTQLKVYYERRLLQARWRLRR